MTRIGPDSWSTNFAHNEFYKYEDKGISQDIEQNETEHNGTERKRSIYGQTER